MPRRSLATLFALAAVVLAAALLPQTPAGRGWLLERARSAAAAAGWEVAWDASAGNPWREVELRGAEVRGPGVDARAARLRVEWFAPGLLTGDLPLWIELEGGRVELDAAGLSAATGDGEGGGGGGPPIRPEIRALEMSDTEVTLGDAPWALPDVALRDLRASGRGSGADVAGRLVTEEGSLAFDARIATSPLRATARLSDVDARLARHWWRGVEAGTAEGTARFEDGEVRVDLSIEGGAIRAAGLEVEDVAGDASYAGGLVSADLSGASMGGPVAATGRVDVVNRRWTASLRGTPRLAAAAERWLPDALPAEARPEGEALVVANASGWTDVEVAGRVEAEGTLAGEPLAFRSEDLRWTTHDGLRLEASGTALGGDVAASTGGSLGPGWRASVAGAAWGPARDVDAEVALGPGGDGTFVASGVVTDVGELSVDGTLAGDDVHAFVAGTLRPGGTLEGALSLALDEGRLEGAVRVHDLPGPEGTPLSLEATAEGPLDALPISVTVDGPATEAPEAGPVRLGTDLGGTVRAVLEDGELRGIDGRLGPLTLAGRADPAAVAAWLGGDGAGDATPDEAEARAVEDGPAASTAGASSASADDPDATADASAAPLDLAVGLDPTPVEAAGVRTEAALADGRIRLPTAAPGEPLVLTGDLSLADVAVPGGAVAPVEGDLTLRWTPGAGPSGRFEAPGLVAELAPDAIDVDLRGLGVAVAGVDGEAEGAVRLPFADPLAGLRGDARLRAGEARVDLSATDAAIAAEGRLPAGTELGAATLREPLTFEAELPDRTAGRLAASLGEARFEGRIDLAADAPLEGVLRTPDPAGDATEATLRLEAEPWRLRASGEAALEPLGRALDLPLAGTLRSGGLALGADGATGEATATLSAPLEATLDWEDGRVEGVVPTPSGDATLAGRLTTDAVDLTIDHPWGRVALDEAGLAGEGTIPGLARAGVEVPPLPWTLRTPTDEPLDLAGLEARVGESRVRLGDAGLEADVEVPLVVDGEATTLRGTLRTVDGEARLDLAADLPGGGRATAAGPLDDLAVALDGPAGRLGEAVGLPVELRGDLALEARVNALAPSVEGGGAWTADGERLDLELGGPPWNAVARGPGIELEVSPETVRVDAEGAELGAFAPALAGVEVAGELSRDLEDLLAAGPDAGLDPGAWRGDLEVRDARFGALRLRGDGPTLRAEGDLAWGGASVRVDGSLLPDPVVNLVGGHEASGLETDVRVARGEDGALGLEGALRWPETGAAAATLPAGEVRVSGTPDDLRLEGPGGDALTYRDGVLGGTLALPVDLAGETHALTLRPEGTTADAAATIDLTGPTLEGSGRLLRSGAWSADLRSDALPVDPPLAVRIDAEGEGLAGSGAWSLGPAGGEATWASGDAAFGPEGATVALDVASLDVAAVADAFGVDAEGAGTGRIEAAWRPEADPSLELAGEATLRAVAAGRPVAFEAAFDEGRPRLRLQALDLELVAERRGAAADWELALAGDAASLAGTLDADLERLEADGSIAGEPASLRIAREADGPVLAVGAWAGARASVAVRATPDGPRADVDLAAPVGADLPAAGTASATLAFGDAGATLQEADLALVAPTPLRAELHGPIWPRADLRGTLATETPLDEAALTLRGPPGDLDVRASLPDLTLEARLQGGAPARVAVTGRGRELYGVEIRPGPAGLAWTEGAGWRGTAEATVATEAGEARAELRGAPEGLLVEVRGDAAAGGASADARLRARVVGPPWAATLDGDGLLEARAAAAPEADGAPLRLDVPVELDGTLLRPRLVGTPVLSGALAAEGRLEAGLDGASLVLDGPGAAFDARADAAGWRVEADLEAFPLDPWLAGLDAPRLDAEARLAAAWGARPEGRVPAWTLRAEGGRVEGTARLEDGLAVTARVDADLGALLGAGASGTVAGPLSIRADAGTPWSRASVTGALRAEDARAGGVAVDGELALGGRLPVPDVVADATLGGPVEGPLRLAWAAERGRLELDADLVAGDVTADVRIAGDAESIDAAGRIATPRGTLGLSAEDGAVFIAGEGGLSGVEARLRPFPTGAAGATLRLPLAAAAPGLPGVAEATIDPAADAWLEGTVRGAAAAGATLPDLALAAEGLRLRAEGAGPSGAVDASIDLADGAWEATVRGLVLPADLRLDADAAGTAATGRADLALRDAAAPDEAGLRVEARLGEDGLSVGANGALRGGTVAVDVRRREGSWDGPVAIEGLPTPAGRLSLHGDAAGSGPWPQAVARVRLEGPANVAGTVTAASDAVSVDLEAGLPGGAGASVQGRLWPAPVLGIEGDEGSLRLEADAWDGDAPWRASGGTTLALPGVAVALDADEATGAPRATLAPTALDDARLVATLPALAPLPAVARTLEEGLAFRGEGALAGEAAWLPPAGLALRGLRWEGAWGGLSLDGRLAADRVDVSGTLDVAAPADGGDAPALPGLVAAPFGEGPLAIRIEGDADALRAAIVPVGREVEAAVADPAVPHAVVDWEGSDRSVAVDVAGGFLTTRATLRPGEGLRGEARLDGMPLPLPGLPETRLSGTFEADGTTLSGEGSVEGPGRASLEGTADLRAFLPAAFLPEGAAAGPAGATSLTLRLAALDPADVPLLAERLPGLAGGLSGVVEVRGTRVIAQLAAPELRTGARAVPLRLEGAGDLATGGVDFSGTLAGSELQGTVDGEAVELLWRLDRFPIQAPLEAFVGPLEVDAEATGVLRARLPFDAGVAPDVRIATEEVRLERAGVVTSGTLAVELQEEGLRIDAEFAGGGSWTAQGTIGAEELDFVLEARDADATALLGLVPSLARLGAGAEGDLEVRATGSPADPRVVVRTDGLELALAGSRYRLSDAEARLEGVDLSVRAAIEGVEPVGGLVRVGGEGRMLLAPLRLEDAAIDLEGDLNLPFVGPAEDVEGVVRADAEGRPYLDLEANLGAPLAVEGTLWPLDLAARGEGLSLRVPALMLASSTADVDLGLVYDDRFRLSGRVGLREGRFALGIRRSGDPAGAAAPAEPAADVAAEGGGDAAEERAGGGTPNPALSRFVLEDLAVVGRRLAFSENFGSAEFDADLRVGGTAAAPRISGSAVAQRGTFRFSGREFSLVEADAVFEPSRGAYPLVRVEAVTTFEKRDVLGSAAQGVSFEAPPGATFDVRLAFEAEVLPTPGEARPFRLDLDPRITSDALVSVPATDDGLTEGTRALTEAELLSLVALGRLDLSNELAGEGGVAGGVAQSALDSAVDLLILSELQEALSEALGLDLVEIRTSTLSSVLSGDEDPFGVSVRVGGYVSEELFASVEISRFGETARDARLMNTVDLVYELGPVEFELATSLGFPQQADLTPVPELSAGLRYQLSERVAIETGATLATPGSEARFGVTLRW